MPTGNRVSVPVRESRSGVMNLHKFWKKRAEARFGTAPGSWVNRLGRRLFARSASGLQVSGYYAWAVK